MSFLTFCVFGAAFINVLVRREEIKTVRCAAMHCICHFDVAESVKVTNAECKIRRRGGGGGGALLDFCVPLPGWVWPFYFCRPGFSSLSWG